MIPLDAAAVATSSTFNLVVTKTKKEKPGQRSTPTSSFLPINRHISGTKKVFKRKKGGGGGGEEFDCNFSMTQTPTMFKKSD